MQYVIEFAPLIAAALVLWRAYYDRAKVEQLARPPKPPPTTALIPGPAPRPTITRQMVLDALRGGEA